MSIVATVSSVNSNIITHQKIDSLWADERNLVSYVPSLEDQANPCRIHPETSDLFLSVIYQKKPPDYYICVGFVGAPALSRWKFTRQPAEATHLVAAFNDRNLVNTYCSTVAYRQKPRFGRGAETDCGAVLAAHVDVDVRGEAHHGKKYPLSKESAIGIVNNIGLQPSIIVDSGYGIQAWWLLESPIITATQQARDDAKILIGMVWAAVATMAAALNYEIDSTPDLARILRVAGTLNVKDAQHPKPATIISLDRSVLYTPDDFRGLGVREDIMRNVARRVRSGENQPPINVDGIDFKSIGLPSEEVIEVFCTNVIGFEDIWNHRPLSGMKDLSDSGYCWWLMRLCALADIPLELTYSLCLGWRTKHNANPDKMKRIGTFIKEYERATRSIPR